MAGCAWLAVALIGCNSDKPARKPAAPTSSAVPRVQPATAPDTSARPVIPVLRTVRTATHADHDRIVFEFDGSMPPYRVSYTDLPVSECGSGKSVDIAGTAVLVVRFSPANAHTDAGEASGAPRHLAAAGGNVREMTQVCDFEAVVEWVIGLQHVRQPDVVELTNPARLAIDIPH